MSSLVSTADAFLLDQFGNGYGATQRPDKELCVHKSGRALRIALAHAHGLSRGGLRALLGGQKGIEIVGDAADYAATIRLVLEHEPDVLVLDWYISRHDDMRVLRELSISARSTRIVLIGVVKSEDGDIWKAIQLGVTGILSDETTTESLCESLRKVAQGEYVMGRVGVESLIGSVRNSKPKSSFQLARRKFGVTRREFEIIAAVAAGYSNLEIAQTFSLSCHTVKHHLSHIFDKVGASNRLELALFALHHRIVEEDEPCEDVRRPQFERGEDR